MFNASVGSGYGKMAYLARIVCVFVLGNARRCHFLWTNTQNLHRDSGHFPSALIQNSRHVYQLHHEDFLIFGGWRSTHTFKAVK